MIHQLSDYDISIKPVKILYDNSNVISLSKKLVHHSRATPIDIKHHFIRDNSLKDDIDISFVSTEFQLENIFTKSLFEERFYFLKISLDMIAQPF